MIITGIGKKFCFKRNENFMNNLIDPQISIKELKQFLKSI